MDPATLIGVLLGLVVIVVANVMEGGNPMSLLLVAPLLLVFGTTLLVTVAGGTMSDAKAAAKAFVYAFTAKVRPAGEVVPTVVSLAEKARKEGLLALEDALKDIDDPFLVKGVTMAIDGTDPEELRDILEAELYAKKAHDKHSAKFFADAGALRPDHRHHRHRHGPGARAREPGQARGARPPDRRGVRRHPVGRHVRQRDLAAVGNRLKRLAELEAARMELIIEGISAIQSGSNPRVDRAEAALAAARRASADEAEAA